MKRRFASLASLVAGLSVTMMAGASAAWADDAGLTKYEEGLVCKLGGTCDNAAPAAAATESSQSRAVGGEATFNIYSGSKAATQTASASASKGAPAPSFYKPAKAPAAPVSTGGQPRFVPVGGATPSAARKSADVRVLFANGSADLDAKGKEDIRAFAHAIQSNSLAGAKFTVEGHTNSVGARDYNLDLSQRRAQAVSDYLVQLGVASARLEPKGYGFDHPRTKNPADGGNRRVEIVNEN